MHNKNIPHLSNVINGEFLFMAIIYYVAKESRTITDGGHNLIKLKELVKEHIPYPETEEDVHEVVKTKEALEILLERKYKEIDSNYKILKKVSNIEDAKRLVDEIWQIKSFVNAIEMELIRRECNDGT